MFIPRKIEKNLKSKLIPGKVVLILGPRRVGKTFLLKKFMEEIDEKFIFWNGEDFGIHNLLKNRSIQNYRSIIGNYKLVIVDEAQKIPDVGNILKLIVDSFDQIKIIATGSSVFDIKNISGEPLTGRKYELLMFPVSEQENKLIETPIQRYDNLRHRMVFGSMPELYAIDNPEDKVNYLKDLISSYLMKDILSLERVKNSEKVFDLLRLVAFQVGNEVSLNELSRELAISKNTVERYLDLLTKVFIIFKLRGFSRNLRKEVINHSKYFFIDNGIRNAVINNFNPIEQRNDIGALWENYMISERIKFQSYNRLYSNNYFWRTYDQQEIDWIEEREGSLFAYEFKWKDQKVKIPKAWTRAYPNSEFIVISQENYFDWITKQS